MWIGGIIGLVDINLLNGCLHVEFLIENNPAWSKPVADECSGVARERQLSLGYAVHPFCELQLGVAVCMVPHTIVEGGARFGIHILGVAKQQIVNVGIFGDRTRRSQKCGQWHESC
uniref:Uncharacterized protein n=1 Tax=Romanomermis culicivorax TaxID=13658 RepID=A0A915KBM8_ROMCU